MSDRVGRWIPDLTPRRLRQLWYVPLLATAMGLVFVRFLVLAWLLDVRSFATFSGGILVSSTFCMLGCLGLQTVLQREWPLDLVRGKKMRGVVQAAQCNLVAAALSAVACVAAAFGLSLAGLQPGMLALSVLHGLAQQTFLIATTESRSSGDALGYAHQQLLRSGTSLLLGAAAAFFTGDARLVIAAEALTSATLSMVFFRRALMRASVAWIVAYALAWRRMPKVRWRTAFVLLAVTLVAFAGLNADRWTASRVLGSVGFAQYSFAAIVLAAAQAMQALANASVYPLLARRWASAGAATAFGICLRLSLGAFAVGAVLIVPLTLAIQYGISRWYPKYLEAAALVPLLLIVGMLRTADFWSSFLLIGGRERRLLKLNVTVVCCAVATWLIWTHRSGSPPISLWDVGLLAFLLTTFGYIATAATAWQVRRQEPS